MDVLNQIRGNWTIDPHGQTEKAEARLDTEGYFEAKIPKWNLLRDEVE